MKRPLLDHLQSGFQDYILGKSQRAMDWVETTTTLSAERRLDIYHNAYRARLVEMLVDTYERVAFYIGDDAFEAAARDFIESNTPSKRNLRDYGNSFPAFLASHFPLDAEIAELAEMDNRLRNAFDGADAEALGADEIAGIAPEDWDRVVFTLHPTASLQRFVWNTPAIWQCLNEEQAPPTATLLPQPVCWLFWRKDLQPHFRSLSAEEQFVLEAILSSQPFGNICTGLAQRFPALDVPQQLGLWLQTWLEDGVMQRQIALSGQV